MRYKKDLLFKAGKWTLTLLISINAHIHAVVIRVLSVVITDASARRLPHLANTVDSDKSKVAAIV
jgi:hypothetical protein